VARLVSTGLAAKLYTDVAPLDAPDGRITACDAWVGPPGVIAGVAPSISRRAVYRLLLCSALRLRYETVAQSTWFGHDQLGSITHGSRPTTMGLLSIDAAATIPFWCALLVLEPATPTATASPTRRPTAPACAFSYRQPRIVARPLELADTAFTVATTRQARRAGESTTAYGLRTSSTPPPNSNRSKPA